MRFLILDANYPGFLQRIYETRPGLERAPYEEQRAHIRAGLFGEVGFQVDALRNLGHEAESIITNAHRAQHAWAVEHDMAELAPRRWHFKLRKRVVPWLTRRDHTISWPLVLAQVRSYAPDVVYVGILDTMPPALVFELRSLTRLVVAQIASPIADADYSGYDLVLSSIPTLVDRFRSWGVPAEWVPLAFEPSVLSEVPPAPRDIPVSFVGSLGPGHTGRVAVLEAIANVAPLQTWTADGASLSPKSPIAPTVRGEAYGRDMYSVLARTRIAVNTHPAIAGPDANNLRLYEATGMGALLLTEERRNLPQLFNIGSEVVTYGSPSEAAELTRYYVDHPDDAARVAAAGRARTTREHTWTDRMARVIALVDLRGRRLR